MSLIQMPPFSPISHEDWNYYLSFQSPLYYFKSVAKDLEEKNRFFTDFRFQKLLYWCAESKEFQGFSKYALFKGKILYRARVYEKDRDDELKTSLFEGYGPKGSFIPPSKEFVTDGRINPKRIVYLYCAESPSTAIAEISPLLKTEISVAEIQIIEPINIISFCKLMNISSGKNDLVSKWRRELFIAFTEIFNHSYANSINYLLCQYISEFYKINGYDGIAFRSSRVEMDHLQENKNICYTIFNYDKCVPVSSKLYYIFGHVYKYKSI